MHFCADNGDMGGSQFSLCSQVKMSIINSVLKWRRNVFTSYSTRPVACVEGLMRMWWEPGQNPEQRPNSLKTIEEGVAYAREALQIF